MQFQDVRAVQVQPEKAASLDTDDVFILEHKTENLWVSESQLWMFHRKIFESLDAPEMFSQVWVGEGASPFEREVAMKVAKELSPDM